MRPEPTRPVAGICPRCAGMIKPNEPYTQARVTGWVHYGARGKTGTLTQVEQLGQVIHDRCVTGADPDPTLF